MLFIYRAHQSRCGRKDLIDEDEDGLLRGELDPLADHVDELAYGEIGRNEVLLLIDSCDVRLLDLLADDLRIVSKGIGRKTVKAAIAAEE